MLLMVATFLYGQQSANISIVHDENRGNLEFLNLVKEEINLLLAQQYDITYNVINISDSNQSTASLIQNTMKSSTDVLITLGFNASSALDAMGQYTIPCISGISLRRLEQESTGIDNYTVIQSPFNIERDFEVFQSIYPFKHLGIFVPDNAPVGLQNFLNNSADGFDIQFISASNIPTNDLGQLNENVDAIYFLPNLYRNENAQEELIEGINNKKLPSFSLIGRDDVEQGILASISPSDYVGIFARRMALNVMKILEGQNPKDLPVSIEGIEDDFVINVATMEQIEIYPPFEVLSKASLINLEPKTGKNYSLQSAVAEALQNNLSYQVAQRDVAVQENEIGIARSNLLPTLDANTTLATLDGATAELLKATNQPTPQTEWSGNLALTQLIYSQPAWANVAIQKTLLESEKAGLLSQHLDLVLDVCTAYLRYLQAQANLKIQNTNVQTTLSNLNIAKTKAKIGTTSNADVYGFESQLALNKVSLNDAQTSVEQARISFNQLLNRPLDEIFLLDDILMDTDILFVLDNRVGETITNSYDFRKFSEFLIETCLQKAPELKQLQWAIQAQETSLDINKKSRYVPQVGLQGNLDKTFGRYGTRVPDEVFEMQGVDAYQPTWNVGVNASLPIFQGNLRTRKIEKDQILLEQLTVNRASVEQQFATNIRLSLENLANSFNDIQFTQQAEESGGKFLELVQNLYREGATTIVTLLDAQNNVVSAQLGAISSRYQFIIDAITIERLINNIYILSTPQEKESFVNDYLTFLTRKK